MPESARAERLIRTRPSVQRTKGRRFKVGKAEGDFVDPFSVPNQPFSRQQEDRDPFGIEGAQGQNALLVPTYSPVACFWTAERSDILQTCVRAYQSNIDGFGYRLNFLGQDRPTDNQPAVGDRVISKTDPEAVAQRQRMEDILLYSNHKQSFSTLRKLFRADYEYAGNGAFEIIRNQKRWIEAIYHAPIRFMRMGPLPDKPIMVQVKIMRGGKLQTFERPVYFRKYAQKLTAKGTITWFKEYGDPRVMDKATGAYVSLSAYKRSIDKTGKVRHYRKVKGELTKFVPASEILWIKQDFAGYPYGIPRWVAASMDILGRHYASYVNYRLIKKGGIPQVIVTVNGGVLTDESYNDLMDAFDEWASTTDTWTNVAVLESIPETIGLEDKGSAKIDLKFVSDSRKEDLMFGQYALNALNHVRNVFRLTPLYTGSTEDVNRATAISSMRVTEQQVFQPERDSFDEIMNWVFRDGLGITLWEYKSNGPRITGDDEFRKGFDYFAKWGGMTINEAVEIANQSLGLEMSKFSQTWANYPIPIVLKLVELGQLGELEKISTGAQTQPQEGFGQPVVPTQKGNLRLVTPSKAARLAKLLDNELFTDDEVALYQKVSELRDIVESIEAAPRATNESDFKM